MVCRRTDLLSKVHRPKARYSRIDGNFYNQAMAMFRYTHPFTSYKKSRDRKRKVALGKCS